MRLIDADNAIHALGVFSDMEHGNKHFLNGINSAKEIINECVTIDAVPVVRCSECISHGTLTNGNLFCGKRFTGVYGEYHVVKPDDYCSYGGRR